jgi:formylglycine-generating enzyme required for sulfatase activity
MIYVPAGRFHYGSDDDETTRAALTHQPGHDLEIGAFLIARTEVTFGEYLAFLRALPDAARVARLPTGLTLGLHGEATVVLGDAVLAESQPFCVPEHPCIDWLRLPVDRVSRDDGEAYAGWLSTTGRLPAARLCTDREWERAARGADGRRYPRSEMGYPAPEDACTFFTYGRRDVKRAGPCLPGAHPASRSVFGVDDLMGNVWEWTATSPDTAQPNLGIVRGGGWSSDDLTLWLANRGYLGRGERFLLYGLRMCADAPDAR